MEHPKSIPFSKKLLDRVGNPLEWSTVNLKEYRCPHCKRFLFKGNVKKLNMLCHHCQELVIMDGNKVIIETDET